MSRARLFLVKLTAVGLLIAVEALADVPSPSTSSVPDLLTLVGRDGVGAIDPADPFTVVVRKLSGNPVPGAYVILDFVDCTDLRFCTDQGDPNVTVVCENRAIRAFADGQGQVTLRIAGCAVNSGASPGPTDPALKVYADGVLLKVVRAAAFDQNGCNGADPNDLSAWLKDSFSGQAYARSDYNGDGALDPNDLSLWLAASFSGASVLGCGSATCP
jgi:hypothetical protein